MDFSLTEEQKHLKITVKKFAEKELVDYAKDIEKNNTPPPTEVIKKFHELGILGVNLPKSYGGLGLSHLDAVIVLEEIAKISSAIAFPVFESSFGPALAIANFGTDEMCNKLSA